MSNLSDLLNPTPPASGAPPGAIEASHLSDPAAHSQHPQPGSGHAQSPRRQSVTSPALDLLAAAASNTLPLFSPTQEQSSVAQVGHTNDVVVNKVLGQALAIQESQIYSQRQPNHHAPNHTGKMQDNTGISEKPFLSPYKPLSPSDQHSAIEHSSPSFQLPADALNIHQISQSLPSHSPHLKENNSSVQPQQFHIKSESGEAPDTEMKEILSPQAPSSTLLQHDPTPGTPLKTVMSNTSSVAPAQNGDPSAIPPKPKRPPKKRAAPKKGTAVKPPGKKRKMEPGSGKASPRPGTPNTSRASGTPVPKRSKQGSVTPTRSSSVGHPEDDEDDGELELFCICRKPDDHTVMIGCDGPCEDWFHTKCVDMTDAKVALISKWYCPNCAAEGHETEWKRMCRLEGCSKPARIEAHHRSKYCCNEHGQEFMILHLNMNEKKVGAAYNSRRRRGANNSDQFEDEGVKQEELDDNRGGTLRPGELKSLLEGVSDVTSFRKLGDGVLSPPYTAATSPLGDKETPIAYSAEELSILDGITQKRSQIEVHKQMLDDRATLVQLVEMRRKSLLVMLKEKEKSLKDICGYDSRLAWSDDELNDWRTSEEGKEQLLKNVLNADPKLVEKEVMEEGEDPEIGIGVCKRKRCERHRTWLKIQQADLALEKDEVRQRLRKLDEEEKGVKERAMIRNLEEAQTGASEA